MIEFDRIMPVINPCCSNLPRAQAYLQQIKKAYPRQTIPGLRSIFTSEDPEITTDRVRRYARDGDILEVLGGDSTVKAVASGIAGRDIILDTTYAGNGNDAARDLKGVFGRKHPAKHLEDGEAVAVHPLAVTIDGLTRYCVNYFGIGASAHGAKLLNSQRWRQLPGYQNDTVRSAYEWLALPATMHLSRRFALREGEEEREILDFTIANGHYLAKHGKLPVHLDEPRAFMFECSNQVGVLPWGLRTIHGKARGNYLEQGERRIMQIGHTVMAHVDGEPFVIEKGCTIAMAIAEKSFLAVRDRRSPSTNN